MKVAICQPTYLPWLGYFDLMDQVDRFVLLDNVQFEKQSWQQRNRIKTPTGLQWLTVPVVFRGRLNQMIRDVEVRETDFARTHLRALEISYGRAPFFSRFFPQFASSLQEVKAGARLLDLNLRLLKWITAALGVSTSLVLASSLNVEGKRTQLLSNICQRLVATEYISPIGSAEYLLQELPILEDARVKTTFHNYVHPQYQQRFPPFIPFASVIDLIFNEGERAMEIIRSGRRVPLTSEQVDGRMTEVKEA